MADTGQENKKWTDSKLDYEFKSIRTELWMLLALISGVALLTIVFNPHEKK